MGVVIQWMNIHGDDHTPACLACQSLDMKKKISAVASSSARGACSFVMNGRQPDNIFLSEQNNRA
jgi:hypothetical protein